MPRLLPALTRLLSRDRSFILFLVTVVLCLLRSRDLPSVSLDAGTAILDVGPADLALLATALAAAARLRERRSLPSRVLLAAAAAFALLIVLSALPNGASATSAGAKLAELAVLTLGAAAFLDRRPRFAALIATLVGLVAVAAAWGLYGFVTSGGGRQASFLGEHDMAALGTMTVAAGLGHLYTRSAAPPAHAVLAIVAGATGITLGASLASLLGLYLVAAGLLALATLRRHVRLPAVAVTLVVAGAVTAGTWAIRGGEFGFLQSWFGAPPEEPGQYAASWSQRLIYAYIGGRIFLEQPVLGTGWHGLLPAEEHARFLPDARERFWDQPPHYFPREDAMFIPQQTYDQVLYELGVVGAIVFVVLGGLAVRAAFRSARAWPRAGPWAEQAYVPAAWLASLAGVLAGAALFGGTPIAAIFWLTVGAAAAAPALAHEAAHG